MSIVHFRMFETKWGSTALRASLCFIIWTMTYLYNEGFGVQSSVHGNHCKICYTSHAANVFSSLFHELEIVSSSYFCRISRGLNKSSKYGTGRNSIKKQDFGLEEFGLEKLS